MDEFSVANKMDIQHGSILRFEDLAIELKRHDFRVEVVNVKSDDGRLYVAMYKEKLWQSLSEQEHKLFYDELSQIFQQLDLKVTETKFDLSK